MTSPPQFYAEGSEPGAPSDEMLAEVTAFLATRDLCGLIWCDDQLRAVHSYGALAALVPLHKNICDGLPPLFGFEQQLAELRVCPGEAVEIPNISFRCGSKASPRLNVSVYWQALRGQYLVLLSRVFRRTDLELELNHQIRLKRIAERGVAEQSRELERLNEELSRANGDLEEFAYVISHDLKAPLRALRYLSSDLKQSLDAGESKPARAQLDQLDRQTRRMSAMLTGLFDYASLGRKRDALTCVDTRALAGRIIASLSHARPGIKIITQGDWPVFDTLEQPLDLVLRNLIENAIKHHDRDVGEIKLRVEDAGDSWAFWVSDDGPGIAPDYQEAVYRPFVKVDGEANPGSSGVGLALVKKTVESIGGAIELISRPDVRRGSAFKVLWPKSSRT